MRIVAAAAAVVVLVLLSCSCRHPKKEKTAASAKTKETVKKYAGLENAEGSVNTYEQLLEKQALALKEAAQTPGAKEIIPPGPKTPYAPVPADTKRGLVVFQPDLCERFTGVRPAADRVNGRIVLRAAKGETESALLGVWALRDLQAVDFSIRKYPAALNGVRLEFLPVVMSPLRKSRKPEYIRAGMWVSGAPAAVDMKKDDCRAWLVRMTAPETTHSGIYRIPLVCSVNGKTVQDAGSIELTILPFALPDPWEKGYVFGTFTAGANFNQAQFAQMKAHGIEGILWFWGHYGLDIFNNKGTLRVDFTRLDRTVGNMIRAGMRGPIVLALGNDSCGHFERRICRQFDLPMQPKVKREGKTVKLAVLDNAEVEKRVIQALRQVLAHAKKNQWPEIVIMPYDEPTERLMAEHRRMVRLLRTHFPDLRLYGCSMNRLDWAKQVSDCDIIVCNGDFKKIRNLAQQKNHSTWFYGGATVRHGFAMARWRYGLERYAFHPHGSWFWSYNYFTGNPWNELDGSRGDSAWIIAWPPLDRKTHPSVNTLAYEGLREGVDDVRYAMALEEMLNTSTFEQAKTVQMEYETLRNRMQKARPGNKEVGDFRGRITDMIIRLKRSASDSPGH